MFLVVYSDKSSVTCGFWPCFILLQDKPYLSINAYMGTGGGLGGGWPPWPPQGGCVLTPPPGGQYFQRKITKNDDFTLPLHDPPGTIVYLDENFICKNALQVKFTLSFLTLGEPPWNFRKKFRRETLKNEVFRKSILTPPTPLDPPLGGPTVPIYVNGFVISGFRKIIWRKIIHPQVGESSLYVIYS